MILHVSMTSRLQAKIKYKEIVENDGDETGVQPEVRSSSVSTFERLQEEIIELEANKRRLRRNVDQLRDEERLLARRLERRSRDTGTATRCSQIT